MPSDASDNLRKFLESDDLAMITMGLSMAKGSADASRQTLGLILGLYMFHGDKEIRSLAKTAFTKLAPSVPKRIVRKYWQAEYRTQSWVWDGWMQKMVSDVDEAGINPVYFLTGVLVTGDEDNRGAIIGILEKIKAVDESSTVVAALVQMIGSVSRYQTTNLTNEKAAIALIEKIGGELAVDALAGLLGNNLKINEAVADSLGTLGDVRVVEPLISVLSSDSKSVARALGILGDDRAVGPLIEILVGIFNSYKTYSYGRKDFDTVIEALVMLGDKKAIEPLVKGLDIVPRGLQDSIIDAISLLLDGLEVDAKEMENLRRFLIGEDAGMRGMGLSMLKGILTEP
jgi:hypothetical protein